MAYIRPHREFQIASMHDDLPLDCRIYHNSKDSKLDDASDRNVRTAIIAHPYAALGGSFDDATVMLLCQEFVAAGYIVGTFNFRGAPGSAGKSSWTSKAEILDLNSFATFMILYSKIIQGSEIGEENGQIQVVLAGYSYGSMIVSRLPSCQDMLHQILESRNTETRKNYLKQIMSFDQHPSTSSKVLDLQGQKDVETALVLICPLLPPVTFFLAPLSMRDFWKAAEKNFPTLITLRTLVVVPESDTFTSTSKIMKWAARLAESNNELQYKQITNGDHFWQNSGARSNLRNCVQTWICESS